MRASILAVVFFVLMMPLAAQPDPSEGLVGYWPMEEGSGDKVADATGKGHDGTIKNAKWVKGKYGNALEFNGVDSIVDIIYKPDLTPADGVTMAAWVYPTDDTRSCIFGQFGGYGMALFTGLKLKWVIWGDDWISDVSIPQNEWSYVAMAYDIKGGKRLMFLNGKLVDEKETHTPIPNVQNHFGIGLWVGWPEAWGDDMFKGIIDEVKIWDRVLSEEELMEASGPAPVEPQGKLATTWAGVKSE